jgi:hypothetical protein
VLRLVREQPGLSPFKVPAHRRVSFRRLEKLRLIRWDDERSGWFEVTKVATGDEGPDPAA